MTIQAYPVSAKSFFLSLFLFVLCFDKGFLHEFAVVSGEARGEFLFVAGRQEGKERNARGRKKRRGRKEGRQNNRVHKETMALVNKMMLSSGVREVAGATRVANTARRLPNRAGNLRVATFERRDARNAPTQGNFRGNVLNLAAAAPDTAEVETERSQLRIKLKCYSHEPLQVRFLFFFLFFSFSSFSFNWEQDISLHWKSKGERDPGVCVCVFRSSDTFLFFSFLLCRRRWKLFWMLHTEQAATRLGQHICQLEEGSTQS